MISPFLIMSPCFTLYFPKFEYADNQPSLCLTSIRLPNFFIWDPIKAIFPSYAEYIGRFSPNFMSIPS